MDHPLRKSVARLKNDVWEARDGRDAYTRISRDDMVEQKVNVDHVVEIQLFEHAAGGILAKHVGLAKCLSDVVNAPLNLNVTTSRINQAKRGPFTSALNRVKSGSYGLRGFSVENMARRGKSKWLIDEGIWENIERETVLSFDAAQERLRDPVGQRLTRAQKKAVNEVLDEAHATLEALKILS